MQRNKFKAIAAILLSVIMLSTSLTAAFAAPESTDSTYATTPWSSFPVQKRFDYDTNFTYAVQTVLRYADDGIYARRLAGLIPASQLTDTSGIDGKFGEDTQLAVEMFQAHNGLTADGRVGPATWAMMYSKIRFITQNPTEYPSGISSNPAPIISSYYGIVGEGTGLLMFVKRNTNGWSVHVPAKASTTSETWYLMGR